VLARVDEREKKRGRQHRAAPFNSASEGGGSGAGIRVEEGERRRGGGLVRRSAPAHGRRVRAGGARAMPSRGDGSLTHGPGAIVTGSAV
jgi:hypothetical protein